MQYMRLEYPQVKCITELASGFNIKNKFGQQKKK